MKIWNKRAFVKSITDHAAQLMSGNVAQRTKLICAFGFSLMRTEMSYKKRLLKLLTLSVLLALPLAQASTQAELAPTPPMGWNSWDSFGTTVTEDEVKANADYMAKNLKAHGWQYIVVDIQWSELHPKTHGYRPNAELNMDQFGRLIPAPNRFPSAIDGRGFAPLAAYVHSKGLKFGIHILRGIPRRAVDVDLPVFQSKLKAAEMANKRAICPWNSDMYGLDMGLVRGICGSLTSRMVRGRSARAGRQARCW